MSGTTELALNVGEMSVCIGFPVNRDVPWPTALSLARTAHACALRGIAFDIQAVAGSSVITTARSTVVHRFLEGKSSRLFWIDSDIEWKAEDFLRMLALSSQMDVICAAYPLKRDDEKRAFVIRHPNAEQYEMNKFGCLEIYGTGLGFTVMTRKVIEQVAASKPRVLNQATDESMAEVFRLDTVDGLIRGEDIAFFEDIRAAGFGVWLDPTVDLGHIGQKVYRGNVVQALRLEHIYGR